METILLSLSLHRILKLTLITELSKSDTREEFASCLQRSENITRKMFLFLAAIVLFHPAHPAHSQMAQRAITQHNACFKGKDPTGDEHFHAVHSE